MSAPDMALDVLGEQLATLAARCKRLQTDLNASESRSGALASCVEGFLKDGPSPINLKLARKLLKSTKTLARKIDEVEAVVCWVSALNCTGREEGLWKFTKKDGNAQRATYKRDRKLVEVTCRQKRSKYRCMRCRAADLLGIGGI